MASAGSKTVDDQIEVDVAPSLSPLVSRFLVISWMYVIEWEIDSKMPNFMVSELKLERQKFVKMEPCVEGISLSKFDKFIAQNLLEQGCRVWIKCISDLENIESNEGCLMRGQRCFCCIQLTNKMQEFRVINYLGHQRFTVRIKKEFPW